VKFGFIAKHRGIWPAGWLCEALGVSRGGFYAWLTRPRSQRSRSDEELGVKVRASFLASGRTYGARRVWRDLLTEGMSCGLHRIERLMRRKRPVCRSRPQDLPAAEPAPVGSNPLGAGRRWLGQLQVN
jgi:putative transposase